MNASTEYKEMKLGEVAHLPFVGRIAKTMIDVYGFYCCKIGGISVRITK